MSNTPIEDDLVYHIYNRGVDKRDIFLEPGDYSRFVHYLYHLNDSTVNNSLSFLLSEKPTLESIQRENSGHKRVPLVDLFAFVLMPNHFHLMLRQREEGGAALFMQKLGTGYTMFFNQKYERSGSLFQGTFKRKPVLSDTQFRYLPHYIHLNPLSLDPAMCGGSQWTLARLKKYKWSSFPDYVGLHNVPSVTMRKEILDVYGGSSRYLRDIESVYQNKMERETLRAELFEISIEER